MSRVFARLLFVAALALSGPAALAGVVIRIGVPPPAPRVEVITVAPSPSHIWIAGHWRWDGRAHVWEGGHWVKGRPGHAWVPARWVEERGRWRYVPGTWHRR